jgi:hypothetical protein
VIISIPLLDDEPLGRGRKWTITGPVMLVTVMQVLDVTATNVALPYIEDAPFAGMDEVCWVLTSHLAVNAVMNSGRPAPSARLAAARRKSST